ncbi:MAG: hypothetical protein ACI81T_000770 [Bacteroidia bacterium]|jgi:hypothetical protein
MELSEVDGFLFLRFVDDKDEEAFYLNVISETKATIGGIGRNKGDVVKILPNGNLYYAGLEMKKSVK